MAAFTNTTIIADTTNVAGFMGAGVYADFTATMQDLIGVYTEAFLCSLVQYDIVTNWASLNAIYKLLFSEYACRTIAIAAIMYDPSGFTDGIEAENMVKVHWQKILDIESLLKKGSVSDFQGV